MQLKTESLNGFPPFAMPARSPKGLDLRNPAVKKQINFTRYLRYKVKMYYCRVYKCEAHYKGDAEAVKLWQQRENVAVGELIRLAREVFPGFPIDSYDADVIK